MSLVCGQYFDPRLLSINRFFRVGKEKGERRDCIKLTSGSFLQLACLPSLRPIATLISDKYKRLHKHKNTHKKSILPLDAVRPNNAPSVVPSSTKYSCDSGYFPRSESLSGVDMEAELPQVETSAL